MMNPGPLDLRDHLAILWARKWTIIAVVITTTAVALAFSLRQIPVYTTSAEVIVEAPRFDLTQPPAQFGVDNMPTEQQVANSTPVTDLASKRLATQGVVPGSMEAALVSEAEALAFTSVSVDPAAAQATAIALAQAYLDLRKEKAVSELQQARQPYEARIAELDGELQRITRNLRIVHDPASRATLDTRYSGLLSERAVFVQRLQDFATPESLQVGEILRFAGLPDAPMGSSHQRDGGLGFLVGLALGIGLAFFRDRMDERVRGREDLESQSGAPVLAFIPRISSRVSSKDPAPIMLSHPTSEAAEAYKALQVRLLHVAKQRSVQSFVITSSLPGEGKTSTTANLGVALARAGKRVVMVSADLRRPQLQKYFPGKNGKGLTDVLLGLRTPLEAISPTGTENLWVLDTGRRSDPEEPVARLGSEAMRDLLTELCGFADFVLLDTPPLLTSSDVVAIGPLTDGALFVADPRLVQRPTVEQARHELQLIGVPVIGVVVNRYDARRFSPYGSGYDYVRDGHEKDSDHVPQMSLQAMPDDLDS
ncbi:MAG: polysaccharide biosynthesis tyrosine autokinase [Actinomycetota bacterium]|nr:polysaccharide biosynthesis tyrosine autokinase [Actinomycetota bacterium]